MESLTEKKQKWIIQQFRAGRSASQIAKIQKTSRQYVYRLAKRFKAEGTTSYRSKKER
jgi:transposase